MKTILATAYAVNPYKGSEDGMGWHFIGQIARFQKVIAVTRENNQPAIEQFLSENPEVPQQQVQFIYFDLPYWMRFWKKGSRGALLYFYLWQFFMPYFVKKQKLSFDIAHNLNFHNDWTPTFLWKLKKPLVWGPVGHHPKIQKAFVAGKQWWKDRFTWWMKNIFWNLDPALRRSRNNANLILAMNTAVANRLKKYQDKTVVLPSVGTTAVDSSVKTGSDHFNILFVGRIVTLKGVDIVLSAFEKFYQHLQEEEKLKVTLTLVGTGRQLAWSRAFVEVHNLQNAVEFIPWIDKAELDKYYRQADLFFFPSHEGAGMVVAEALSYGVPVLCFDNEGPGELAGNKASLQIKSGQKYNATVAQFANALGKLYGDKAYTGQLGQYAKLRFQNHLHWDRKGEVLTEIYSSL